MKKLVSAAIACAVMAVPVYGQEVREDGAIVVQPERSNFVTSLNREIDRELYRVRYPTGRQQSGIVKIHFMANGHGRAEQVSLYEESGSHSMDRAALRAIHRLRNIEPASWSDEGGQAVLLNVVFATSQREADRLVERATREHAELIASGELDPEILALTVVPAGRS